MRLSMGYPNLQEEMTLISARKTVNPLSLVSPVTDSGSLTELRRMVSEVKVSAEIAKFIVTLVGETRKSDKITLGASPRASLALMKLSQAYAFIRGRDYVLAEDVSALFAPCVAHRIMLSQEARLEKKTAQDVLAEIARTVEVPYRSAR